MPVLSERLEIRVSKEVAQQLREEARQRQVSVSELVREAIDFLLVHDKEARQRAAEALFQIEAPVADWPDMEKEIELGFLGIQTDRENGEK